MTPTALTLVLVSAALHAYWNSLVKSAQDKAAFTWLYLLCSSALALPVAVVTLCEGVTARGWTFAVCSGLLYAMYFVSASVMYEHGELSVAYPIARGVAPALSIVWAVLFLHEQVSLLGVLGVALIVVAIFALAPAIRVGEANSFRAIRAALFTGLLTSIYANTDKLGTLEIGPLRFVCLCYVLSFAFYSAFASAAIRRARLSAELQRARWRPLTVGALSLGSYWLLLIAVLTSNVSYVVPLRSTAILFGVALGTTTLGETRSAGKWVCAVLMLTGAALIALRG